MLATTLYEKKNMNNTNQINKNVQMNILHFVCIIIITLITLQTKSGRLTLETSPLYLRIEIACQNKERFNQTKKKQKQKQKKKQKKK